MTESDSFSRCAVHLTMGYQGQTIAIGSGVIGAHPSGGRYLITAWHNLAGKDPVTGVALSRTLGIPNTVQIEGYHTKLLAKLYDGGNDPLADRPLFATHSAGSKIDVTVLRLPGGASINQALDVSFLTPRSNIQLPLFVSQTCYILGFPEGLIHRPEPNVVFPIWKTGHLASEPNYDFDDEPKLLVDATTRRGMSGAMVIVRREEQQRNRFVGIYTGRFRQGGSPGGDEGDSNFTTELGWVFKSHVADELIAAT